MLVLGFKNLNKKSSDDDCSVITAFMLQIAVLDAKLMRDCLTYNY